MQSSAVSDLLREGQVQVSARDQHTPRRFFNRVGGTDYGIQPTSRGVEPSNARLEHGTRGG